MKASRVLGKIININKDLYTVMVNDSVFPCYVRGKLRGVKLTVGDDVIISSDTLTIEEVKPRKNSLVRPLISNIDKLFIVISTHIPEFSTYLLDKFLVLSYINNIEPVIIVTKLDICDKLEKREVIRCLKYYKKQGYKVFINKDIRKIKREMRGCVVALAGQTGAGKSTFLNRIDKSLNLKTGEVSTHLGRGKHTTRMVSLIPIKDALVADTPGFSSLEIDATNEEIRNAFVEFGFKCKYSTCTHVKDDGCFVIERVKKGVILRSRYENYLKLIKER